LNSSEYILEVVRALQLVNKLFRKFSGSKTLFDLLVFVVLSWKNNHALGGGWKKFSIIQRFRGVRTP